MHKSVMKTYKHNIDILVFLLVVLPFSFSKIEVEPLVEMRWDFSDCGQNGRFGPSQILCEESYKDTNLEGDVIVEHGIQTWTTPSSGLYLITARGASGLTSPGRVGGRGAEVTSEFRLDKGEKLRILVGQKSDFDTTTFSFLGPGGSGGTFVTRISDNYVLMVAGGGSSSAGRIPRLSLRGAADANINENGKNASETNEVYGTGGKSGSGGFRGFFSGAQTSTSGGGAGFYGNGNYSITRGEPFQDLESPSPSIRYSSNGVSNRASGVGGFFMFYSREVLQNNGGFGGGGSGSVDGGAGGGGGYSGGGGGPWNGWGGGGGSINNGEKFIPVVLHSEKGSVSISLIGYSCCGPVTLYAAASFVAGILIEVLCIYLVFKLCKNCFWRNRKVSENENNVKSLTGIDMNSKSSENLRSTGHRNPAFGESSDVVERKNFYRPRKRSYSD